MSKEDTPRYTLNIMSNYHDIVKNIAEEIIIEHCKSLSIEPDNLLKSLVVKDYFCFVDIYLKPRHIAMRLPFSEEKQSSSSVEDESYASVEADFFERVKTNVQELLNE